MWESSSQSRAAAWGNSDVQIRQRAELSVIQIKYEVLKESFTLAKGMITVYTLGNLQTFWWNSSPSCFFCFASSTVLSTPLEVGLLVSTKLGFLVPAKRGIGLQAYHMDIPMSLDGWGRVMKLECNEMQWSIPWCRTERAAGCRWMRSVELCGLTEQYGWLCSLTGLDCNHTGILPWENPICSRLAGRHGSAAAVH